MLGILCARHKPWMLASLSLARTSPAALTNRVAGNQFRLLGGSQPLRLPSRPCRLSGEGGVAASIWHAILPSGGVGKLLAFQNMRGEGSWKVAWDARPARWLHRPDPAWLLFGVCACRAAPLEWAYVSTEAVVVSDGENCNGCGTDNKVAETNHEDVAKPRVTGVTADGRCLFRATAHVASVRNGEETPDENRQRELADELRAQVVDELLRRRKKRLNGSSKKILTHT